MSYFHLRLLVPNLPLNYVPNTLLWPLLTYVVDGAHLRPITMQSNYQVSFMKNISCSFTAINSFARVHSSGTLQLSINLGESSEVGGHLQTQMTTGSSHEQILNEEIQVDIHSDSAESLSNEDRKETQRRRKIGLANRGKVPWNKGRKHSAETRERIKQKTIEALRDPKVRKKMSECHRAHSDQSKERISLAQRRVWGERLKLKRLRERFFLTWVDSIAKAAKSGDNDQQELDWDSYDKIKAEITLQQLQWAADKAKAKEIAKIRVEKEKAEKMARLAQKKGEKEPKAKAKGERKRKTRRKSKEKKKELAISCRLKLKERLPKIHKKRPINGEVTRRWDMGTDHQTISEKWDLEFIKREKMRKEASLADQIQAAKNKRAEFAATESLKASSSNYPADVKTGKLAYFPLVQLLEP